MRRDRARHERLARAVEARKRKHVMDSASWRDSAVEVGRPSKRCKNHGPDMSQVMKADDPTEAWMDWFFQPESVAQDDWCADDIVVEHGNDWRGQEGRPGSSIDPQPIYMPSRDSGVEVSIFDISDDRGGQDDRSTN